MTATFRRVTRVLHAADAAKDRLPISRRKKVVAESAESLEAMEKLRQIGADYVQDFAVGAQMAMESIGAW